MLNRIRIPIYVRGPSKVIVSLSKAPSVDETTIKAVWPHMTEGERRKYLKANPQSKMHAVLKKEEDEARVREELAKPKKDEPVKPKFEVPTAETVKHPPINENAVDDEDPDLEDQDQDTEDEPAPKKRKTKGKRKTTDKDGDDEDPEDAPEKADPDDWWDVLTSDEQDAYLKRHPKSRRKKTRAKGLVKHAMTLASSKVHGKAKKLGRDYRWGMKGLRALKNGKPMTPGQKKGLKKTATLVAGLALAAVAGLALFTPLGGLAMDVGEAYIQHLTGLNDNKGEASSKDVENSEHVLYEDQDAQTLDEFQNGLTAWLVKQDPKELAERIKKSKGK